MTHRPRSYRWLIVTLLVCAPFAAAAQTAGTDTGTTSAKSPALASKACRVVDVAPQKAPPGGAGMLFAVCGSEGAPLGTATKYSVEVNAASSSVLVVCQRGRRTKVLLASPTVDGSAVHVDDITRDLAKMGGRAGNLGLGDLTVDTSHFATDGKVGVTRGGATQRLDLAPYTSRAATLVASPLTTTTANPKTGE